MHIRNICCLFLSLIISASAFADSLSVHYDPSQTKGHIDAKVYVGNMGPYQLCAQSPGNDNNACNGIPSYLDINPYHYKKITLPKYHLTLSTSVGLSHSGGCNYTVVLGKNSSVVEVYNSGGSGCSYSYWVTG